MRRPAWQLCLAGLIVGLIVAIGPWHFPIWLAMNPIASGAAFALWPVMWIVFNALLLYNISVRSGRFDAFKNWIIKSLPGDRRIILVVVGFSFSALLERIAGFGTPVAIASALLIMGGFPALVAVVFTLIFNTTPVGYAALGTPVTVLAAVTHLPPYLLAAMVGRQLPIFSLLLPFYVIAVYGGIRSIRGVWPVLLMAGGSFALAQFLCSNFLNYALTDVLSSLSSIVFTLILLKYWKPTHDSQFQVADWHVRRKSAFSTTVFGHVDRIPLSVSALVTMHAPRSTDFRWPRSLRRQPNPPHSPSSNRLKQETARPSQFLQDSPSFPAG
jgi:lactate permease